MRKRELNENRAYQLWLIQHQEQVRIDAAQKQRKILEGLELFNSNLQVRVARLNAYGELYGSANAMLETQKIAYSEFLNKTKLNHTLQFGPEFLKPFGMLNHYKCLPQVKLEVIMAIYMFFFHRNFEKFESKAPSFFLDLEKVNVISGWMIGFIGYFLAGGIRATNSHFSLFECLPDEQKKKLISRNDREGKILNRFCGSDQNRAESLMLRTLALRLNTAPFDSVFIKPDSKSVASLLAGEIISPQKLIADNIHTDDEKSIANGLSYFGDFEVNDGIQTVFEQHAILTGVFVTLGLMQNLESDFFDWFYDLVVKMSHGDIKPHSEIDSAIVESLNNHFRLFENHEIGSELYLCMQKLGINENPNDKGLFSLSGKKLKDHLSFTADDFPTLNGFIKEAVRSNNLGGALSPHYSLENLNESI